MLKTCQEHISFIIQCRNPKFGVWMHLGITVALTSGLSSRIIVSCISLISFDVGISNFVCGYALLLLIVAYYFVVTVTFTLTAFVYKMCMEPISFTIILHRNPKCDLRIHIGVVECCILFLVTVTLTSSLNSLKNRIVLHNI